MDVHEADSPCPQPLPENVAPDPRIYQSPWKEAAAGTREAVGLGAAPNGNPKAGQGQKGVSCLRTAVSRNQAILEPPMEL